MAPNAKESPPKPGLVKAHAAKPGSKPICDQISSSRPSTATSHDVLPALPPAAAAGGPNKASGGPNKTEVMKGSPMYEPTAAPSAQPALTTFLSTRLLAGMGALAVLGGLILLVGHSPAAAPLGARGDLMLDRNGHRLLLDSDGIEVNIGDSLPPPPSHHPHHPPPPHPSPPPPPLPPPLDTTMFMFFSVALVALAITLITFVALNLIIPRQDLYQGLTKDLMETEAQRIQKRLREEEQKRLREEAKRRLLELYANRRAQRKERILHTPPRLHVGMSGTASLLDIEEVCPTVTAKKLQDESLLTAHRSDSDGIRGRRAVLEHVVVVVTRVHPPSPLVKHERCDVMLFASEPPALQAISCLGGDDTKSMPVPLRRLDEMALEDARDLCDKWEVAPWAGPAEMGGRLKDAIGAVTDFLHSPQGVWSKWLEVERRRQEFAAIISPRSPRSRGLSPALRLGASVERDAWDADKWQQLASRVMAAPWNQGESTCWSPRKAIASPGRGDGMFGTAGVSPKGHSPKRPGSPGLASPPRRASSPSRKGASQAPSPFTRPPSSQRLAGTRFPTDAELAAAMRSGQPITTARKNGSGSKKSVLEQL